MKQHEAVIKVMEENGGYATLGQLYQFAPKVPGSKWEGTKTPFASIRRIVQTHPEFFKIRPGLWALTAQQDEVLQKLSLHDSAPPPKVEEFTHSYFQGLILEIGNLKHYRTFAPSQDKNKPFLNKKLADVATLREFYSFSYEHLVQRARTIDISWFNERKLPNTFFEVEHSTDFYNSFLKFVDLQDFNVEFKIVADQARIHEYESKLQGSAFKPIASRVKFLNYDHISSWHAHETELSLLQQNA
jgi:hypothetical protein